MLRKFGYATLALLGVAMLASNAYEYTSYTKVNDYVLAQHRAVDRLGHAAPLESRIVVGLSRLPNELFQFITPAQAQQVPGTVVNRGQLLNHQEFACTGTRPTVTNATLTSGSCDFRGQITNVLTAGPVITFGTAYQAAPICTITRSDGNSTGTALAWTVSTTAITIAGATVGAGVTYNWLCLGVML